MFPNEKIILKPKEQKLIKIEAPFVDEISGLAIVKIIDRLTQSTIMLKVKFTQNLAMLYIMNSSSEILILSPKEVIGILDLRSLGFYKIQQGVLQQNLSKFCKFKSAESVCNQSNNIINTLQKEEQLETGEKYRWLDKMDERKYKSDREILEKYIDLKNTCLQEEEREEVMDMLYKYKEAFSLRDEIGTCPNTQVEIDVTDKSPFLLDHIMLEKKIRML